MLVDDRALDQAEAAEADLRKLAKEIAAEGVSPRYYEEHKRRAGRRTAKTTRPAAAGESRPEATEPITAGAELSHPDTPQPEQ